MQRLICIVLLVVLQQSYCMIIREMGINTHSHDIVEKLHKISTSAKQACRAIHSKYDDVIGRIKIKNAFIAQNFRNIFNKATLIHDIRALVDKKTINESHMFTQNDCESNLKFCTLIESITNIPNELECINQTCIAECRVIIAKQLLDYCKTLFDQHKDDNKTQIVIMKKAEYICYIVAYTDNDRNKLLYDNYTKAFLNGDKAKMYEKICTEDFWRSICTLHAMIDDKTAVEIWANRLTQCSLQNQLY